MARLLGLSEVPVLVLSHLTVPERRAYKLADNKFAQNASWEVEIQGQISRRRISAERDTRWRAVFGSVPPQFVLPLV